MTGPVRYGNIFGSTKADEEELTVTTYRTTSLPWYRVQEIQIEPEARNGVLYDLVAYDDRGRRLWLPHAPTDRAALDRLRELWIAGRGENWVRVVDVPAPGGPRLTLFTGVPLALGLAGFILLLAMLLLSVALPDLVELNRRGVVLHLVALVVAPLVAFTVAVTRARAKRRKEIVTWFRLSRTPSR